jgi:ACS family hexuronate transporter-like MFS transporter
MESLARPTHGSSWRWWITGLLLLATTINYMDRSALAGASVRVTHELGLDDAQYGQLELAFGWAFAVGSLVFGFLSDRFAVYALYPVILVGWSLSGMATGWTQGFGGLLACRTMLGFFEAGHWPCAVKTTFMVLNAKERTMGNSILQSGASIGAIVTPQVIKLLVTDQPGSWRSTFVIVGAAGMLWVVLWFVFLRPRDLASAPVAETKRDALGLGRILVSARFWAVALLIVGAQTVWHINRVWLMKFLQTGRGYDEPAALDFNSAYFIATDVGCIFAGFASLWLGKYWGFSPHRARRAVYAGACVLTSLSVLLPWLGKGPALLAVLLLIGAGALALFPCYYSFVQELSDVHVGRLTGLLSMWVWAVTSPLQPLFGRIADLTADPAKRYDMGLVIAGLVPWIGVIAMKFLWRERPEPAVMLATSNKPESYAD